MTLGLAWRRALLLAAMAAALVGCGTDSVGADGEERAAQARQALSAPGGGGMGGGGASASGGLGGAGSVGSTSVGPGSGGATGGTGLGGASGGTPVGGGGEGGTGLGGASGGTPVGGGGESGTDCAPDQPLPPECTPGGDSSGDSGGGGLGGGGSGGAGGSGGSAGGSGGTDTGEELVCGSPDDGYPPSDDVNGFDPDDLAELETELMFVLADGPTNGNGNEIITAAACREACAAANQPTSACRQLCRALKKTGCNGLWSFCKHLLRHRQKQAAEACFATYNVICAGK